MADKKNEKEQTSEADKVLEKLAALARPADILVVDDVYANRFLIETILGGHYVSEGVASAAEMWRFLHKKKPRLMLLDLMMPFEDGFETLKKIKEDPAVKDIPVIVVSAKDTKDDVVRAMKLGAADYLVKPVEEALLLYKIRKILGEPDPAPVLALPV
jgi:CheY-like chemotaxis protein